MTQDRRVPGELGSRADPGLPADPEDQTRGHRLVPPSALPEWLRPVVDHAEGATLPEWMLQAASPAPRTARASAVLMLFAAGAAGPDLLLTRRAATLRSHAGQPAFPGGAIDPGEDAIAAALREAEEETGVDQRSVLPAAVLPRLYLGPSDFAVRPVVGHWQRPGPVRVVDENETTRVTRVPVHELADPANRGIVAIRRPDGPVLRTPAFAVADMVVWGFTAGLVDLLLEWGGWAGPWDRDHVLEWR